KGAFQIKTPLEVTVDPPNGVDQGGFANIHVRLLDIDTPFDPNDITVTSASADVAFSIPTSSDYGADFSVQADVLAAPGDIDIVVNSGNVDSPATKAFKVAARAPKMLTA